MDTLRLYSFGEQKTARLNKPRLGFAKKQGLVVSGDNGDVVKRHIKEFRVEATNSSLEMWVTKLRLKRFSTVERLT